MRLGDKKLMPWPLARELRSNTAGTTERRIRPPPGAGKDFQRMKPPTGSLPSVLLPTASKAINRRKQGRLGAQAKRFLPQRRPDQSSATRMESTGLEGSYLTLAGWPGTSRSRRTWLSRPVMSCAV